MNKMSRLNIGHVYKITYPNGKIYIGQDWTDDICYFGSANRARLTKDFTRKQRRDFTIRKQILCELRNCTRAELNAKERFYILKYCSTNPAIGYNRTRYKEKK